MAEENLWFIPLKLVLWLHEEELRDTGGEPGLRGDQGLDLLESALAQPFVTFGEEYLHTDMFEMAAAYVFHISKNHPFVDGNKRTATVAALAFLEMNGISLDMDDDNLADIVERTVRNEAGKNDLANFFRAASQKPNPSEPSPSND